MYWKDIRGFPCDSVGKESACSVGDSVQSLCQEDPLEKEMATHSSILAWRIPWTEEAGGLQSMGKDTKVSVTKFVLFISSCLKSVLEIENKQRTVYIYANLC